MNVRSLYDEGLYSDCFELLQYEFLKHSKYIGLLYLYGKYIVKANILAKQIDLENEPQFNYIGSGIGALEECLKSSMPEYHSRINFYIGLAFSHKNCKQRMPLKAVNFWSEAKHFQLPYQGYKKVKQIKKFLDQYSFMDKILEMVQKSLSQSNSQSTIEVQNLAESYISVLSTF